MPIKVSNKKATLLREVEKEENGKGTNEYIFVNKE